MEYSLIATGTMAVMNAEISSEANLDVMANIKQVQNLVSTACLSVSHFLFHSLPVSFYGTLSLCLSLLFYPYAFSWQRRLSVHRLSQSSALLRTVYGYHVALKLYGNPRKVCRLMFSVVLICLSICLFFVCKQHYSTSYERIAMKCYGEVQGGTRKKLLLHLCNNSASRKPYHAISIYCPHCTMWGNDLPRPRKSVLSECFV